MSSLDRQAPGDGLHLMRTIDLMTLTDDELEALAVGTAQSAVRVLEASGDEPGEKLQACANGDPEQLAAYVAQYRRSPADVA